MERSSELEAYGQTFSSAESPLLQQLRLASGEKFSATQMISGVQMATLIQQLMQLNQAVRALDIGTFTGYSALAMAEAFEAMDRASPGSGPARQVITIEKSTEAFAHFQTFLHQTSLANYVRPLCGDAKTVLDSLEGAFDLIFIDADKAGTAAYYEWSVAHLQPRGVLLVDDVLWYGHVLQPESDKRAAAMHAFNQQVKADSRVSHVLLPLRHGVQMIVKKPGN